MKLVLSWRKYIKPDGFYVPDASTRSFIPSHMSDRLWKSAYTCSILKKSEITDFPLITQKIKYPLWTILNEWSWYYMNMMIINSLPICSNLWIKGMLIHHFLFFENYSASTYVGGRACWKWGLGMSCILNFQPYVSNLTHP